jgi:hypothetical protein
MCSGRNCGSVACVSNLPLELRRSSVIFVRWWGCVAVHVEDKNTNDDNDVRELMRIAVLLGGSDK